MSPSQPRFESLQCFSPAGLHRLAWTEWGDPANPRVLVSVHGLTRVGRDFDDLARAMADRYRVVCPDMPGRGRSDWLPDPMLYAVPTYINDVVTLLARLDAQTVHWVGTSMGGIIGMGLASLPDTPISRLVLNDMGPVVEGASLARIATYLGVPQRFASLAEAETYIRQVSAPFGPLTDAQWSHLTAIALRRDPQDASAWLLHYDPALAVPFRAGARPDGGYDDMPLWTFYDKVRCPTLAVRGELSDLLSRATHVEMARRGPKAELVEIAGVGHAPTFMSADQIEVVRNFLLRDG